MTAAATDAPPSDLATRPLPPAPGVRHSWVEARGVRLHVAEAGDGDPVVLLHGWPQHWWMWRDLIGPLAEERRVVCPDLRGFGWSDAPPDGYEKESLADDVLALLDTLGVERFSLVGHDWGGWVAFLIALREPERVERLLALSIPPPFADPGLGALREVHRLAYQVALSAPLAGRRVAQALPRWAAARGAPPGWGEREREIFLGQLAERARAEATVRLYRTFLTREAPAIALGRYRDARLRVPARLVVGQHEPVVRPALLTGWEGRADDLQLEIVARAGHFIVDERPSLVLERARALLRA